jgi:hypothetical protein
VPRVQLRIDHLDDNIAVDALYASTVSCIEPQIGTVPFPFPDQPLSLDAHISVLHTSATWYVTSCQPRAPREHLLTSTIASIRPSDGRDRSPYAR